MYKIIGKSNYDLENVSDVLVCENVNLYYSEFICNKLNVNGYDNEMYYIRVEPDYELYVFEP